MTLLGYNIHSFTLLVALQFFCMVYLEAQELTTPPVSAEVVALYSRRGWKFTMQTSGPLEHRESNSVSLEKKPQQMFVEQDV